MVVVFFVESAVALAAILTFIVLYAARTPGWWRTPEGRHMMGLSAMLGVLFTLVFVGRVMGRGAGLTAWTLAMAGLDFILVAQVFLLLRLQRKDKDRVD